MNLPDEKPIHEEENLPVNDEQAASVPAETRPADETTPASAKSEPFDDATFPLEDEPIDLSEILTPREFKPDFDLDSEPEYTPLPSRISTTRRRRPRKPLFTRPDIEELDERLESMERRAAPTIDLFTYSLLCGLILGIGYLFDAPALVLMGILVTPVLLPLAGSIFAASTGETRFFSQTMGAILTALLLVFVTGALAGLVSRLLPLHSSVQIFLPARFRWTDFLLLAIATGIFIVSFIQSDEKPYLASLALTYGLFLPVSAAGFGLGSGIEGLWPEAILVFLVNLSFCMVIGLAVFFYLGFRPADGAGYILGVSVLFVSLVLITAIAGMSLIVANRPAQAAATSTETATPLLPTPTLMLPTLSPVPSQTVAASTPLAPVSASATPTIGRILITPTGGTTPTITPMPTPRYGRISSSGDGAVIREEPGGPAITTLQNGYLVEILPEDPIVIDNVTWIHVMVKTPSRDIVGWVLLSLVVTSTPAP